MIMPISIQRAVKLLDEREEPGMADAMIGNLECGYLAAAAGIDDDGELHFHVTEAGMRHVEDMIQRHGLDPDPARCWSCGHPFDAGCECSCCYDDHSGEPGPHE